MPITLNIRTDESEQLRARKALMEGKKHKLTTTRWAVDASDPNQLRTLWWTLWPATYDGQPITAAELANPEAYKRRVDPDKVEQMERVIWLNTARPDEYETLWLQQWPIDPDLPAKERSRRLGQVRRRINSRSWDDLAAKWRLLNTPTVEDPDGPDTVDDRAVLEADLYMAEKTPGDRQMHYFFYVHALDGTTIPNVLPEPHVAPFMMGLAESRGIKLGEVFQYLPAALPLRQH